MAFFKKLAYGASAAALLAMASTAAVHAQSTSASLRGSVVDAQGNPIAGASVTIIHTESGTASRTVTNETGAFSQAGLRVGGPFTITVSAAGFEGEAIDGLRFVPGANAPLTIALNPQVTDVVVVTGQAINRMDLNNGVGSVYSASDISNQPAANRDVIATLVRDPLAFSGGEGNLFVAGTNPRFNGLAIDGALQQDDFGLGSNTYATERSPISIDTIESASLVATDYSVEVSGFTGGLVNITTKSGTNEFDGSAYYYYQDEGFYGDETEDTTITVAPFEEKEYGFTLGGPIVRDRLFFFVAYDEFESGSGRAFAQDDIDDDIDPAFYSAFNDFVQSELGFDMQGRPDTVSTPVTSERLLGKIDWNINEDHRASFTYQSTEETGTSVGRQDFVSAWYDIPVELTAYSGQLYSDWTDNFSTQFRASFKEFTRGQICRAGSDQPHLEFRLNEADLAGSQFDGMITGSSQEFFVGGCDRFRHANEFADERLQLFGKGDYQVGDHLITFGGEYENYELYNLFVQSSNGRFIYNTLDDVRNNTPVINYNNATTNDANDASAAFALEKYTAFVQDTWQIHPDLSVDLGLRYEYFVQDDTPPTDADIDALYGAGTTGENLDGRDLIMPRISARWTPTDNTTVTGGFGLFAGGEPKVWISNAFQGKTGSASQSGVALANLDVPQNLLDAVAAQDGTVIDVIANDFEIPADWKASIRVDHEFDANWFGLNLGEGYVASAQYLLTVPQNNFIWTNLAQTELAAALPTGVAPDGRTIYADLQALGISNLTELGNTDGSESHVFTVSLQKDFDFGAGFFVSYAYQDIEWLSEGGSSRGISNWRGITAVDRNNPEARTSFWEVEDSFKISLYYERDFIADLTTRFDVFGQIRSGVPYTLTYDVGSSNALFGRAGDFESPFDNNPLYIPMQGGDPNVVFASGFDQDGFFDFVEQVGAPQGQIHDVNSATSTWNQQWDFRVQQELPGIPGVGRFVGDNNFALVLDIINFPNLLNSDWGTQFGAASFGQLGIVEADLVSAADVAANGVDGATALTGDAPRTTCVSQGSCVYRYNEFDPQPASDKNEFDSLYQIRVGIRYEF